MHNPREDTEPWYRQFWPWFIIALPLAAVIASVTTFYIALNNPEHMVVDDQEYRKLKSEMRAILPAKQTGSDAEVANKPPAAPE